MTSNALQKTINNNLQVIHNDKVSNLSRNIRRTIAQMEQATLDSTPIQSTLVDSSVGKLNHILKTNEYM